MVSKSAQDIIKTENISHISNFLLFGVSRMGPQCFDSMRFSALVGKWGQRMQSSDSGCDLPNVTETTHVLPDPMITKALCSSYSLISQRETWHRYFINFSNC